MAGNHGTRRTKHRGVLNSLAVPFTGSPAFKANRPKTTGAARGRQRAQRGSVDLAAQLLAMSNRLSEAALAAKSGWRVETSIFAESKRHEDTKSLLKRAFEADWARTKIPRVSIRGLRKGEEKDMDLAAAKEILFDHFPMLITAFNESCARFGTGTGHEFLFLGPQAFIDLMKEWGVVDNKTAKVSDLDRTFLAVNFVSAPSAGAGSGADNSGGSRPGTAGSEGRINANPARAFCRFEWLEMIFRVAVQKFVDSKECTRAAEAVERFLREYVAPHCNFQRPERFRREHMYAPDVETLLKHLWVDLRDLFQRFALNQGKAALSKVKRLGLLSPETYCALMAESGLMNDADAVLEVCRAWGMSKETEVDPITAPHAHKLRFREFLEVVGRLAMRHPAVNSKIAQEESLKRTFMAIQQYPDADSHDLSTRLKHLHELMCPPPDSDTGEKKTANTAGAFLQVLTTKNTARKFASRFQSRRRR